MKPNIVFIPLILLFLNFHCPGADNSKSLNSISTIAGVQHAKLHEKKPGGLLMAAWIEEQGKL